MLLRPVLRDAGLAAGAGVLGVGALALRTRLAVQPRRRWWDARAAGAGAPVWVALGDSLTQGTGSSAPATSWVGRCAAGLDVRIDNRAVYGARLDDVLGDQLDRGPLEHAAVVTVCVGSNDAGRTDPAEFRVRLGRLCERLPAGAVVGDVPEFQWGPRIAAAAALSQVVRDVVAEHPHLVLAPVQRETTGTRIATELAGDFFHPNDAGHARIARAFGPAVRSRLAAPAPS